MPTKQIEHLRLDQGFDPEAIPSVRRYLGSTIKGNSTDFRTPLFKAGNRYPDRQILLGRLCKTLFDNRFRDRYSWIYEYEMEMREKAGPMSIRLPWVKRIPDLEFYYKDINLPTESFTPEDRTNVINFFHARRNIRARAFPNTVEHMKLSTNSGTPFFTTRSKVSKLTLAGLLANGSHWHHDGYDMIGYYHNFAMGAVIGWRGQEGGEDLFDVKQRIVFQFPFSINILELCVYQPLIEYVQALDLIPAYISNDRVDTEVTALFDSKPADDYVICTDFTRFDQHFNSEMQGIARDVISFMLANNEVNKGWIQNIFPVKFNIPMITPHCVGRGPHGMGSGSGGTNFDECIAHKALQFHAASNAGQELNPHSMAYGDDGILTFPGITPEYIEEQYTSFGQDVNQSKFHVSKDTAKVLRRIYHKDYRPDGTMRGVYSIIRAFNHLITQERYYDSKKWSREMVELRGLSIIENTKGHPLFHKFIDFVLQGDKYKLGLLIPGFYANLSSGVKYASQNFSGLFSYNQELRNDPKGIYNWEVVKYLLSKK